MATLLLSTVAQYHVVVVFQRSLDGNHGTYRDLIHRHKSAIDLGAVRPYLAEFGIVAPVGRNGVERLLELRP